MKNIKNKELEFSFDDNGLISSLKGREGYEFVASPGLWRIIYQRGDEMEIELLASDISGRVCEEADGSKCVIHENDLVRVCMKAHMENNSVLFDAEITCKSDITVREFQFPYFNSGFLSGFSLIRSSYGGAIFKDLASSFSDYHTQYIAQDNRAVCMSELYPGQAAMNCFCIFKPDHYGLYYGSHDDSFQTTLHHLRRSDSGIHTSMVKYPFLKKGGSVTINNFVLAPFNGDWHEAAGIYRTWVDSWFRAPEVPSWIRNFNGWQRLIMRHQYGQTFFKYADMPRMLADGLTAGIDSLFLFGWWTAGMDAAYPDYMADNEQGGAAALKDGIEKVHEQGGRVLLYFNGQLIDHDTEFYRRLGKRIAVKLERGDEHIEFYRFSGEGTSLQMFGNRAFSVACFSCAEWIEILKSCIDHTVEIDADCVFFDQFGNVLGPCFDPSHGHPVPDMQTFATKMKVVKELYDYAKKQSPGIAFGTEMITDCLASCTDFFHTVNCGYGPCRGGGEAFLEWFRFIFPEVQISDRDIRDDKSDFKRRTNHAIQMGLKSDVEIFRCRDTVTAAPRYAEYLRQANIFRQEVKEFIFSGRFLDDTPLNVSNPDIRAKAFRNGDRLLVLVTHRMETPVSGILNVPGYCCEEVKKLGPARVNKCPNNDLELTLPADSLVGALYRQTGGIVS